MRIASERFDTTVSEHGVGQVILVIRSCGRFSYFGFHSRHRNAVDVGEEEEQPEEEDENVSEEEEEEEEEELYDDGEGTARSGTPESTRSRYSSGGAPSLDARAQLARDLLALKGTELGWVMSILERECPAALETDEQIPRHLELNLDVMTPAVFARVAQYASEQSSGRKRGVHPDDIQLDDVSGKRRRKR